METRRWNEAVAMVSIGQPGHRGKQSYQCGNGYNTDTLVYGRRFAPCEGGEVCRVQAVVLEPEDVAAEARGEEGRHREPPGKKEKAGCETSLLPISTYQ